MKGWNKYDEQNTATQHSTTIDRLQTAPSHAVRTAQRTGEHNNHTTQRRTQSTDGIERATDKEQTSKHQPAVNHETR